MAGKSLVVIAHSTRKKGSFCVVFPSLISLIIVIVRNHATKDLPHYLSLSKARLSQAFKAVLEIQLKFTSIFLQKSTFLEGLSHEMDLALDDMYG